MADYIKDMEKEWEEHQNIKVYPNIVVLGVTGCGKSSLINNVFGKDVALVSDIQPETQEFKTFLGKENGTGINLIDSKGYELEDNSGSYIERLKEKITLMKQEKEEIHIVWFCLSVAKKRVEEMDLAILKKTLEIKELKGRVFVVLTKCDEDDEEGSVTKEYRKVLNDSFTDLRIYEVSIEEELDLEIDKLLEDSALSLDNDDLRNSFIGTQSKNLELKKSQASSALSKYIVMASGIGAVPIPFSDSALLIPLQLKMITEITDIYGMRNISTFSKGVVSNIVISNIGKSLAGSIIKFIPGVGSIVGGVINTGVASSITYGLGKAVSEICLSNCKKVLNGEKISPLEIFNSDILVALSKKFFEEYMKKN